MIWWNPDNCLVHKQNCYLQISSNRDVWIDWANSDCLQRDFCRAAQKPTNALAFSNKSVRGPYSAAKVLLHYSTVWWTHPEPIPLSANKECNVFSYGGDIAQNQHREIYLKPSAENFPTQRCYSDKPAHTHFDFQQIFSEMTRINEITAGIQSSTNIQPIGCTCSGLGYC